MKKVLFVAMAVATVTLFSSCEEILNQGPLKETYTLKAGETDKITDSDNILTDAGLSMWTSNDEFVATISGNTVTAQHVGTTTIKSYLGSSATVVVEPQYTHLDEPLLDFGLTQEQLKAKKGEPIATSSDGNSLYYNSSNQYTDQEVYIFEDGVMTGGALTTKEGVDKSTYHNFLVERYEMTTEAEDGNVYAYWHGTNSNPEIEHIVSMYPQDSYYVIYYYPYVPSEETADSKSAAELPLRKL